MQTNRLVPHSLICQLTLPLALAGRWRIGDSWVFEGAVLSHCLQPGWVGSALGAVRESKGEVREAEKKKKNFSGIFLLGSSA